jgi:hypothetical protein
MIVAQEVADNLPDFVYDTDTDSALRVRMFTPKALDPSLRRRPASQAVVDKISWTITQGRSEMDAVEDYIAAGGSGDITYLGIVRGV